MSQVLHEPLSRANNGIAPHDDPPRSDAPPILGLIRRLLDRFHEEGIRYCQWKSNLQLAESLAGEGDLDLLIGRTDIPGFESIVAGLGFKRTNDHLRAHLPSVIHFYGLDDAGGALVHLHVYYRLLTGETVLKNYHLPVEQLLLTDTREFLGVRIPNASAELLLFVLRAMLKYSSLAESFLLRGKGGALRAELDALLQQGTLEEAKRLLSKWLPNFDPGLFAQCAEALGQKGGSFRRYRLARRARAQLACYRRFSSVKEKLLRAGLFLKALLFRWRRGGRKTLASGGALIAFTGPDASGKSTMVKETSGWLGKVFKVRTGHLGRPPSTWLTWLPNLAKWALQFIRPGSGAEAGPDAPGTPARKPSFIQRARAVLLALERRALARRLHRRAANGEIVICDRYPSPILGAMDGARLSGDGFLARLESRIYRQIAPPDLLIELSVPVEVAVERNRERQAEGKQEPEAYLRLRHASPILPTFANARRVVLETGRDRPATLQAARQIVWEIL